MLVLVQWRRGPGGLYRPHLAALLGVLAMLGGALVTVFGLYLPMFQIGAVV